MKRESFIFYKSFYESIKELAPEEQVIIYNAIFNYEFNGIYPELTGISKSIFTLIIPQLEANNKRYENGKKGGRPKKENNQSETKTKPNNNQNETKLKPNDNVNDNDNENLNDNVNDNENIYIYIETNFGRTLSPVEYGNICQWLLDYDEEIVRYAIDKSILAGKKTIAYVNGILKNWKGCNYTTLQEIKDNEKNPKIKELEYSPKWDESKNDDLLTDEELKDLEKQLGGK